MLKLMTATELTYRKDINIHDIALLEKILERFYGPEDTPEKQICRDYMVEENFVTGYAHIITAHLINRIATFSEAFDIGREYTIGVQKKAYENIKDCQDTGKMSPNQIENEKRTP